MQTLAGVHWRFWLLFFGLASAPSTLLLVGYGASSLVLLACAALLFIYTLVAGLTRLSVPIRSELRLPVQQSFASLFLLGVTGATLISLARHSTLSTSYALSASSNTNILLMLTTPLIGLWVFDRSPKAKTIAAKGIILGFAIVPILLLGLDAISGQLSANLALIQRGFRVLNTSAITSPNTVAFLMSCGLMASFIALRRSSHLLFLAGMACATFYLLLVQSKGAFAILGIVFLLSLMGHRTIKVVLWTLVILWALSASILIVIYTAMASLGLDQLLVRDGAEYLGVATGRTLTWVAALETIGAASLGKIVLGHGFMGAIDTEVLSTFSFIFRFVEPDELVSSVFSLHNAGLQVMFDLGIVGLGFYLFGLLSAAHFTNTQTEHGRISSLVLAFLLLWGLNEAAGTVYFVFSILPFLFVITLSIDPINRAIDRTAI